MKLCQIDVSCAPKLRKLPFHLYRGLLNFYKYVVQFFQSLLRFPRKLKHLCKINCHSLNEEFCIKESKYILNECVTNVVDYFLIQKISFKWRKIFFTFLSNLKKARKRKGKIFNKKAGENDESYFLKFIDFLHYLLWPQIFDFIKNEKTEIEPVEEEIVKEFYFNELGEFCLEMHNNIPDL